MNNRPMFSKNLKTERFLNHYWYKSELQSICSLYDLPSIGTKAELQEFIIGFLEGKQVLILDHKSIKNV